MSRPSTISDGDPPRPKFSPDRFDEPESMFDEADIDPPRPGVN